MSRVRQGRHAWTVVALAAAALLTPATGQAQRIEAELTGGAAVGNYTATDAGLDLLPRPSFGLRLDLYAMENVAGYLGFTRASFGCEEAFCSDRDVSITSQGIVAGARWSPGLLWVRGGLAFQDLAVDAVGGIPDDAEAGFGFEVAGGLDFGIGGELRVRPGIRYLRHQASSSDDDAHVALLALEVGVAMPLVSF